MTDNKQYRISIDPRILELLGPSLYTNIYFILAELIANAYDANASNVYIVQEKGRLTVEDDGSGMSYEEGDIGKYLDVAKETRTSEEDDFVKGSNGRRKKMGRKGVGKLAALSVSDEVEVKTVKNGERSGFVLSRNVSEDKLLKPIPDDEVSFLKVSEYGTSVVMKSPQYALHKTLGAIRNNLSKIFPFVDESFKIHVEVGGKTSTIDSFEKDLIKGLGGLITLGKDYEFLSKCFDSQIGKDEKYNNDLLKKLPSHKKSLVLKCKDGEEDSFELEVKGWIGVYRSTKGRKRNPEDFPDNFISLLSNKKLGEYNILPLVGKNAMTEVYVVGQLHVDLFEETSLPDMALSNRQGYKTDDRRYQEVIKYVRDELLPKVVSLRVKYASFVKQKKDFESNKKDREREVEFREQIDNFKDSASSYAASGLFKKLKNETANEEEIRNVIRKAINTRLPDMGIKRTLDKRKKKLLISHSLKDKPVCDFIFELLVYNGVNPEDVIYTSSDNPSSIIPRKTPIFEYLREFFVESYSTEKIYVVYVTSESMAKSWAAVSEVGAGWITKSEHDIFNINSFSPKKPLDVEVAWANVEADTESGITLSLHEANRVVEKIEGITEAIGYQSKSRELIMQEVEKISNIAG